MAGTVWKDYSLRGEGANGATSLTKDEFEDKVEKAWHSCPVDRKKFKELIRRADQPALGFFALWLGLLAASGTVAFFSWGTWWAIPAFLVYGVLYSASDHRHHELSHGTPFKTRWINEALYHLCAFMTLHEGYYYRWSHTRHHTHTLLVGRDPEIASPRPPSLLNQALDFFHLRSGLRAIARIVRHACGRLSEDGKHFVPDSERAKVIRSSRVYVGIFLLVGAVCLWSDSILPAMFIVLPRFYGGPLTQLFNLTQHAGLAEDVYDHRLNTRTVIMNPVFSFLYANMNYHVEHHMFPMVPFYRLPQLHEMIKADCPAPYRSIWAAWKELIPTLVRQRNSPSWYIDRASRGPDRNIAEMNPAAGSEVAA